MKDSQGRKPLSSKSRTVSINPDTAFSNKMAIPPEVKAFMDQNGMEPHWLDAKKLQENGGYHDRDWQPFIRPDDLKKGVADFKFGTDPDGVVRRGSLILGFKTKEDAEKHRSFNTQRADRYKQVFNKKQSDELKQMAKESNVQILEDVEDESGYE